MNKHSKHLQTWVTNEAYDRFLAWCSLYDIRPYRALADFVYTVTGVARRSPKLRSTDKRRKRSLRLRPAHRMTQDDAPSKREAACTDDEQSDRGVSDGHVLARPTSADPCHKVTMGKKAGDNK